MYYLGGYAALIGRYHVLPRGVCGPAYPYPTLPYHALITSRYHRIRFQIRPDTVPDTS
jgi:hypothetical protein